MSSYPNQDSPSLFTFISTYYQYMPRVFFLFPFYSLAIQSLQWAVPSVSLHLYCSLLCAWFPSLLPSSPSAMLSSATTGPSTGLRLLLLVSVLRVHYRTQQYHSFCLSIVLFSSPFLFFRCSLNCALSMKQSLKSFVLYTQFVSTLVTHLYVCSLLILASLRSGWRSPLRFLWSPLKILFPSPFSPPSSFCRLRSLHCPLPPPLLLLPLLLFRSLFAPSLSRSFPLWWTRSPPFSPMLLPSLPTPRPTTSISIRSFVCSDS